MSKNIRMVSGYQIEAVKARPALGELAMVTLHRKGSNERGFLTPPEAKQLAISLLAAVTDAEGESSES